VANWTYLKTLALTDPLGALNKRNPKYCERYAADGDAFGYDIETYARWEPLFRFLFEDYFKVDVRGIENIPAEGRGILVGNHSGLLPLDGAMLSIAMCNYHNSPRRVRYLVTDWFFTVPGLNKWIRETGQVRATLANAQQLLADQELVGIYPEGIRGVGKPFKERYRVLDFHPGFVQLALETQTPIIPISTVGGDEIFPNFVNLRDVARQVGMPFFPITLTFPWLPFPLGFIPLPVKWMINIHKPIELNYPASKAKDRKFVLGIARDIQHSIQDDLNDMLRRRKSVFTGWDDDNEFTPDQGDAVK
jgi:1-acyl-sn-glycerol-3-phosphate acyltransferase